MRRVECQDKNRDLFGAKGEGWGWDCRPVWWGNAGLAPYCFCWGDAGCRLGSGREDDGTVEAALIFGITTAESEKRDQRLANRRLRRAVRRAMGRGEEGLPVLREVSDVWGFEKDGKQWWRGAGEREMRK